MRFFLLFLFCAAVSKAANKYCSFTAANGTDVESYSTSGEAAFTANSAVTAGQCVIYENRLRCNSTTAIVVYANNFTPASADYSVEADLTIVSVPGSNGAVYGVGGRCGTTAFTGYYTLLERASGAWRLVLYRGGSGTPLGTYATGTPVVGERHFISLNMKGNDIKVFWNGVQRISVTAAGADIISATGVASIYLTGVSGHITDTTGVHMDRFFVSDEESPPTTYSIYAPSDTPASAASGSIVYRPTGLLTGTITPTDGGMGGTFSPTTLTWSGTQEPQIVTYTAGGWAGPNVSGTNNASLTDADAVPVMGRLTIANTDLHQNGYNGTPTWSPFSTLEFSTNSIGLIVTGTTDIYGSFPAWAQLGWRIDGTKQTVMDFTVNGSKVFTHTLASGTKRIELFSGMQGRPSATILGTYLTKVQIDAGSIAYKRTPYSTGRLLVYGDSISVGANSTDPETDGWAPKLRTLGRRVMVEGHGSRALYHDGVDSTARETFATRLAGYNPWVIYLCIGTNDYGLNLWTAANFGTAYADLLDRLHTKLPNVRIYCQSPLQRTSEGANGLGSTLPNYRTQISSAASARSSYCTYVEGAAQAIVPTAELDDGLHPNTTGHATYAAFVHALLPRAAAPQGIITP